MNNWRIEHGKTIQAFLEYLNKRSKDFILKGGTALLVCYKLDRFSEDIDLDGRRKNIEEIIKGFCEINNCSYHISKDTDTVKKYKINYGNMEKPLKIEVSFRRQEIDIEETTIINGVLVYKLDPLCIMKTNAYTSRDKIRDLYDVSFICNNYFDQLAPQTIAILRSAIEYKGIEQFDYIIKDQHDELIDKDKLAGDFLSMHDKLGLLCDKNEKKIISSIVEKIEKQSMKERMAIAESQANQQNQRSQQAIDQQHRQDKSASER